MILDSLLTRYSCIIFMLRKPDVLDTTSYRPIETDAELPSPPLALLAAREFVKNLTRIISHNPCQETVSTFIGAFESYVAIAYVLREELHADDIGRLQGDVESLERFSTCITTISWGSSEFQSLVRALRSLSAEVHRRVELMVQKAKLGGH